MRYNDDLEALIDIAVVAGRLLSQEKIKVADSRTIPQVIFQAAQAFLSEHKSTDRGVADYITTLDSFAERELRRIFAESPNNWVYPKPPARMSDE